MAVFYVKKPDKVKKIHKMFKIITINNNIYEIPTEDKRTIHKLVNKLKLAKASNIILSNTINNKQEVEQYLKDNKFNILSDKILIKRLILKCLDFIESKGKQLSDLEVSILLKAKGNLEESLIKEIAKKVKILNIITPKISEFKQIEEYLYNEFGIIIRISNNKSKGLLKSDIIVNVDLNQDEIGKYKLPNKAIILNLQYDIKIRQKSFNGININRIKIDIPKEFRKKGFSNEALAEGYLLEGRLNLDRIKIVNFIGNNGIINFSEN